MSLNYARFASSLLIFHMINVHFMKYHKISKASKNQLREPQRSSSLRSGGSQPGCAFFRFFEVPGLKSLVILPVLSKSAMNPFLFAKTMENSRFQEKTTLKSLTERLRYGAPLLAASLGWMGLARDSKIYHRNNWAN